MPEKENKAFFEAVVAEMREQHRFSLDQFRRLLMHYAHVPFACVPEHFARFALLEGRARELEDHSLMDRLSVLLIVFGELWLAHVEVTSDLHEQERVAAAGVEEIVNTGWVYLIGRGFAPDEEEPEAPT